MKTAELADLLDRRALRQLAGAQSFERGEDYFARGQVRAVTEDEGTLSATVQGARRYRVALRADGGTVEFSCTCPMGQDGAFCKHCVAAALAWLDARSAQATPPKRKKGMATVTMDDVRGYLATQEKTVLVELLMQHATEHDQLRQRLLLRAAKRSPKGLDASTYRRAIDVAVDTGEYVEYRAAHGYALGIDDVIDSLAELLREGYAGEVVELAEYALAEVEVAMQSVDDSDGYMSGVLERLQNLHLKACTTAKPDPEALAERLFEWELRAEGDIFYGAVVTYASVLGKKGIAVYRRLAEAAWAKVPARGPGRADVGDFARYFKITHVMEALARQSGDIEAVVAIKQRDLSLAYSYLQIAETYKAARKHDQALEWAERGVKAFPEHTDSRLREFLADEYHRRQRHDEAMALVWAEFTDAPVLDRYRVLKGHADRIGQWEVWRAKAIARLRESIATAGSDTGTDRRIWSRRTDRSELVRIFLWEKNVDVAWSEAVDGGCSDDLWMELAGKRETAHPDDALPIYQRQIEPTLQRKNNDAYRAAVGLLRRIRGLMARLGREAEFARYLESVRAGHKAKRNFVKLLDGAKWA